ncbi:MAG TPA: hypothetical protein VEV87_07385, partial [Chitinophagaceae bacterium]|nr:hypothetical protein [Chitinophagaceae bacterium]
ILLVLMVATLYACSKSNGGGGGGGGMVFTPTCSAAVSFTGDVAPIVQNSCAISGCHATGSINGPGALTSYQQVFNNRAAIRTAVANGTMPKTGTLSASQKNAILCWIDAGAVSN